MKVTLWIPGYPKCVVTLNLNFFSQIHKTSLANFNIHTSSRPSNYGLFMRLLLPYIFSLVHKPFLHWSIADTYFILHSSSPTHISKKSSRIHKNTFEQHFSWRFFCVENMKYYINEGNHFFKIKENSNFFFYELLASKKNMIISLHWSNRIIKCWNLKIISNFKIS